jgi:hypothetical protein
MSTSQPTHLLKALYYPYARCTNQNTLKRAILLFDEVWLIDPTSQTMRESLLADQRSLPRQIVEEWKNIQDAYGMLIEKHIVRLYDPEQLILSNDHLLSGTLQADLDDDEVWKLCTVSGTPPVWSMLRRKIPPSAFGFLNSQTPARVTLSTEAAREFFYKGSVHPPEKKTRLFQSPLDPSPEREKLTRYRFYDDKVAWALDTLADTGPYVQEVRTGIHGTKELAKLAPEREFSCTFPFTHGSSLALNEALLVADALDLIPFTDSVLHHQLLLLKYQRSLKNLSTLNPRVLSGIPPLHPEKLRRVAFTLFDTLIPEPLLEKISFADAVKYRAASKPSFERLKLYIAELTAHIESEIWDEQFEVEVQKIVYEKILPEARKTEEEALAVYEQLFGSLAKKAVTILTPTTAASIFAGLSIPQLLLVGSASVLGTVTSDLIDAYLAKRKSRRNVLTYLFALQHTS